MTPLEFLKRHLGWIPARAYLILVTEVLIGLGLALGVYFVIRTQEQSLQQKRFETDSLAIKTAIDFRFQTTLQSVATVSFYFDATESAEFTGFTQFTNGLLNATRAVRVLQWVPEVPLANRTWFEERINSSLPNFAIKQRNSTGSLVVAPYNRDFYYPVYYLNPVAGNTGVIGFDMGSDVERTRVLGITNKTGETAISRKITLIQCSCTGVLAFRKVAYNRQWGVNSFTGAVYQLSAVAEDATSTTAGNGISFGLFETNPANSSNTVLYYRHGDLANAKMPLVPEQMKGHFTYKSAFPIGDTQWTFVAVPTNKYMRKIQSYFSVTMSVVVAFIAFLFFVFLFNNLWRHKPDFDEEDNEGSDPSKENSKA